MNKTADIETAVLDWLADGPLAIGDLADRFRRIAPGEQLTWLGIAMHKLEGAGKVSYPSCSASHNHDGPCTVELAR